MPRGKSFRKQSQELIANVIKFCQKEKENNGPLIPFAAVQERAAAALQIDITSVKRISSKIRNKIPFSSPKKRKPMPKPTVDVDSFCEAAIRNVIYEMYRNKTYVTVKTLLDLLKDRDIFHGGISSLRKVLPTIGFKWKKTDNRRALFELPYIVDLRVNFLKKFVRNMKSANPMKCVFLDETWIFQRGTASKVRSWQDETPHSSKATTASHQSEGKRYIVLHAGSTDGWIPGADLIFASKKNTADYHGEMNQLTFQKWFEEQLLKNLDEPHIIVMDNASYHSALAEKVPNTGWKKEEIRTWLTSKNISLEPNLLKSELLSLVAVNKPPKKYVIDELAEKYGHKVLRTPPYHCIFNPIEHVWGITKTYYNKNIGKSGYSEQHVLDMWKESIDRVDPQMWKNSIQHVEKEIQSWWDREVFIDEEDLAPIIIHLGDESDDSDSSEYMSDSEEYTSD